MVAYYNEFKPEAAEKEIIARANAIKGIGYILSLATDEGRSK